MTEQGKRNARPFEKERFRLAAFDFDGTLIPAYKEVPEEERKALKALTQAGVYVAAASGRNLTQVPPSVLGLFRFCVLLNGAYILDRGKDSVLFAAEMDREKCAETARILEGYGGIPILYQGPVSTTMKEIRNVAHWGAKHYEDGDRELVKLVFERNADLVDSVASYLEADPAPVYKMHVIFKDASVQREAAEAMAHIRGFTVLRMTNGDLEITNEGVSKATGLRILAESLGLSMDNVVTFGDSLNDLEMMQASGYTVAMGNSDAFLFDIADHIADTCENDGAAKAVRELYGLDF